MSYPHPTPSGAAMPPQQTQTPMTGESPAMPENAGVAERGKQGAQQVAQTASERAKDVKDEAVHQARDLVGEARTQVTSQAGQQQQALVNNLRSLGSELRSMAHHGGQTGVATDFAAQAEQRINGLADWLEKREPGQVLDEVRDFARRRPGTFLVGALAAGMVAGRLARGAVDVHTGGDAGSAQQPPPVPQGVTTSGGIAP